MRIKLGQLVNSKEGLGVIATSKFKATQLYEITRFVKDVTSHIDDFEKVRQEKIKQYGVEKPNDKGDTVIEVPKDNMPEFMADINELINKEIEIELPTIKVSDLGDTEMSPQVLMSLNYIFEGQNGD